MERGTDVRLPALVVAVTHLIAAGMGAFVLAPGRDPDRDRYEKLADVVEHSRSWAIGWLSFVVAALAMIWLFVALRRRIDPAGTSVGLRVAVALTVLGAAVESVAHSISAVGLPAIAEGGVSEDRGNAFGDQTLLFGIHDAMARTADFMATVPAAAGFGIATLLATLALLRTSIGRGAVVLGFVNAGGAALMIGGGLVRSAAVGQMAAIVVIGSLVLFSLAIAFSPWSRELRGPVEPTVSEP